MNARMWVMAKTQPEDETLWLPLTYHLRDTLGVMSYLLSHWASPSMKRATGLSEDELVRVARFLAMTHDLGKCTPVFQRKMLGGFPEIESAMERGGLCVRQTFEHGGQTPHGKAGAELLRQAGCPQSVTVVVGAHHGRPEDALAYPMDSLKDYPQNYFGDGPEARAAWRRAQAAVISDALAEADFGTMADVCELPIRAQMLTTGLLIMADWIASNTKYFPLISRDDSPDGYDERRVDRAVERLDLPEPWQVEEHWRAPSFFRDRFSFAPNGIQRTVEETASTMRGPGVMILEAPMGAGKTEAALAAAEILMNRFHLGGMAFFLPSQATSNAMFTRLSAWASAQPDAERLTIQLAHAMADMNDEFAALSEGAVRVEEDASAKDALMVHAFFRGRKTNLLAELVIGTVDQLLMAGLKQKHVMLRHLGLSGKVVIVDECHAYDAYMNRYLDRALGWLGAYGVPVILLSATLPCKRREELLAAYLNKRRLNDADVASSEDYPLLTYSDGGAARMRRISAEGAERAVTVQRVTEEGLAEELETVLKAGGCAGIIVNTVRRVVEMEKRLRLRYPQAVILVDHSQFLMPDRLAHEQEILRRVGKRSTPKDRAGVVVIGSQVLEQSLDLDFDLLCTDLCPMDLLLQRVGRLHRHCRERPEALREARCLVLHADAASLESGAKAVYGAYLLMRTCGLLPERILLPKDISPLVQRAYDEARWTPEADDAYSAAKDEYLLRQQKRRAKAKAFCLEATGREDAEDTLIDMMAQAPGMTDPQAQAAVRDGVASIEVLVVRLEEGGWVTLLSGEGKGMRVPIDREPDRREARAISRQRLRLPARFSMPWNADRTIDALQADTDGYLAQWQGSPLLGGELFLLLDAERTHELCGVRLTYDERVGLSVKEDANGNG